MVVLLPCARSACRKAILMAPRKRPPEHPTGIRVPSNARPSGRCLRMRLTDGALPEGQHMKPVSTAMDVSPEDVFPELTRDVIDRMKGAANPRLREVMTVVVRHLHAIAREANLTQDEWWQAIGFLTRAGQMCSDNRQEFILLSDILGVS